MAAVLAGARPEVDDVVGGPDRLLVVLDDDHRVAEIAQPRQRREQLAVVPLVEADRGLVEHVQHAREIGADLRRKPDPLPLAARQRGGAAAQGQVADADIVEESQAFLDLAQDPFGDDRLAVGQIQRFEHLQGFGDRQVHVLRHRSPLHLDRQALRLEPVAPAGRARPQRSERVEVGLIGPGAFLVTAAQVGQDPFELPRAEQQHLALTARKFSERRGEIDGEVAAERLQRLANQLAIAARPRRDGAVGQRLGLVGHDPARIEVHGGPEALAIRAGAVRRVERKGSRRHLRHAQPAVDTREAPREQPVSLVERVDDDDVVGEVEGGVDRLGEPPFDTAADDQAIHDDLDRVVAPPIELDVLVERAELAVDPRLGEAAAAQRGELFLELALAPADDRREHVDPRVLRVEHHHVGDALERLAGDLLAAVRTVRHADAREQQPQVVVDLGDRADGGARVRAGRLLFDGNRRREPVDEVDVRLLHLLEELPGVGGQRLDIPPLPFGVDGVEGERRLPRSRQPGDDDQAMPWDVDVDILEVMNARAANGYPVVRHCFPRGFAPNARQLSRAPRRRRAPFAWLARALARRRSADY